MALKELIDGFDGAYETLRPGDYVKVREPCRALSGFLAGMPEKVVGPELAAHLNWLIEGRKKVNTALETILKVAAGKPQDKNAVLRVKPHLDKIGQWLDTRRDGYQRLRKGLNDALREMLFAGRALGQNPTQQRFTALDAAIRKWSAAASNDLSFVPGSRATQFVGRLRMVADELLKVAIVFSADNDPAAQLRGKFRAALDKFSAIRA